jgi:hypothetical protein
MSQTIVDFQSSLRTMPVTDPEDRALLGSNPSAAAGDGDSSRGFWLTVAPAPERFLLAVLVQKAINPLPFVTIQLCRKPSPLTRPVCHMAISTGLEPGNRIRTINMPTLTGLKNLSPIVNGICCKVL